MWTMGYNEEMNLPPESFNGRKLRSLVPLPAASGRLYKADLLSFNPQLGGMIDQSKQVVVTSRWNPTPEQLQTLEELYQRGTRTPSADQIQHITAQLRRYGKIEGKNVFYWFQNHKARERQKRRRQNESESDHEQQQQCRETDNSQSRESGIEANNKTGVEIEHTKSCSWAYTTGTSPSTPVPDPHQKTATLARAAGLKAAAGNPDCVILPADGWLRFHEREKFPLERNATWQMLHRGFIDATTTSSTAITTTVTDDRVDATINPNFTKSLQDQTLELFPLRSGNEDGSVVGKAEDDTCRFDNSFQFFEFLPLKN